MFARNRPVAAIAGSMPFYVIFGAQVLQFVFELLQLRADASEPIAVRASLWRRRTRLREQGGAAKGPELELWSTGGGADATAGDGAAHLARRVSVDRDDVALPGLLTSCHGANPCVSGRSIALAFRRVR